MVFVTTGDSLTALGDVAEAPVALSLDINDDGLLEGICRTVLFLFTLWGTSTISPF